MSTTAQPTTKTAAATDSANPSTAPSSSGGTFQSASLYVGDLHPEITEGTLFEMFNRVGPVASIRVCRDAVTRRSLGYGYVNFHDVQDAERALDTMQFTEIKGKACRIMWSQRDPALRKSGVGNVFIKNLAKTVDNKHMFDIFSMFGNILSCKVVVDDTGASKGYGYVHFETAEAATEAVSKLNGGQIEDMEVSVTPFVRVQDRDGQDDWTNLYVKQFPVTYEEKDLTEIFGAYGTLASVFIKKDEAGKSTGTGFVNFENHEDASAALEALHEKSYDVPEAVADGEATTFSLFVSKGQKKAERTREIKSKVDALQQEKIAKFNGKNLFVKNLDDSIDDTFLKETFAPYGTITSAKVVRDEAISGNPSKGFGFVCYTTTDEATRAVGELNGKLIRSKPIVVTLHQRKEQRRAQLAAQYAPRGMRYQQGMPGGGMYGMPGPYGPGPQNGFGGPQQRGPGGQNFGGFQGGFPGPRGNMGGPRGPGGYGNNFMPPANYGGQPNMMQGPGQFRGPMGGGRNMPMRGGQQGGRGPGGPMQGGRGPGGPMGGPRPMGMQQGGMPMGRGGGAPRGYAQSGGPMGGAPMGGGRPGGMMMGGNPQMMNNAPQQMGAPQDNEAFDHEALASAPPNQQKNMIGEKLFPLICKRNQLMAPKITGMLLEMDNAELVNLIETPDALDEKIDEALTVLEKAQKNEPAE
jgi:polyadenylate-binding protein